VLFHKVLELYLIRFFSTVSESVFVVSYVLLLNYWCEEIGIWASSALVVGHGDFFWHVLGWIKVQTWVIKVAVEVWSRIIVRVIVWHIQVIHASWALGSQFLIFVNLKLNVLAIERVAHELPEICSNTPRVLMMDSYCVFERFFIAL